MKPDPASRPWRSARIGSGAPRRTRAPRARAHAAAAACLLLLGGACGEGGGQRHRTGQAPPPSAEEIAAGETLFERYCAACHGPAASGTAQGPPLVHRVYEPSHHGDFAFVRAVTHGVRAHHWRFGDMPPVPEIDAEETLLVVAYVRHLQRQAGIF